MIGFTFDCETHDRDGDARMLQLRALPSKVTCVDGIETPGVLNDCRTTMQRASWSSIGIVGSYPACGRGEERS